MKSLARLIALSLFLATTSAQELADGQVNLVSARLAQSARRSWEIGTRVQAILEHNATRYSVFSNSDLPPPANVPGDQQGALTPVWEIARQVLGGLGGNDPAPLLGDSSVADPASVGIAMLLANWTNLDSKDDQYERAARNQYNYLYSSSVPKTGEGAISHRIEEAQLWSDSVFMIPPFLAYYGVITDNRTVVQQAYDQIKLARDQLYDSNAKVWRHVVGGSRGTDPGYWATGNAWAAAGMLRVYATIDKSDFSGKMKSQKKDLKNWVKEIHQGVYENYFDGENTLRNYLNDPNTFYDTASTALLAATVYRASTVMDTHTYVPYAERSRLTLFTPNSGPYSNTNWTGFSNYEHFTSDGWLRPVVNPVNIGESMANGGSPEAQAFVVMMHSAWRDWRWAGEKGKNAAVGSRAGLGLSSVLLAVLCTVLGISLM